MFSHRQTQLAVGTISLLVAMLLFGQPANAARPLVLRVLSYNIHHGEGVDGKLDLQRIARVITSVMFDGKAFWPAEHHGNAHGSHGNAHGSMTVDASAWLPHEAARGWFNDTINHTGACFY